MDKIEFPESLLLIGNGFDLALGSKTDYASFYNCLENALSYSEEDFLKKYLSSDNQILVTSFYKKVNELKDNYFIQYFINYHTVFNCWLAFEVELQRIICGFDRLLTYLNDTKKQYIDGTGSNLILNLRLLDDPQLLSILNTNSKNKFFDAWVSFNDIKWSKESALRFDIKDADNKSLDTLRNAIFNFCNNFPKCLYDDLTNFSNLFSIYLGIVNHYVELKGFEQIISESDYLVTYNYTTYAEKMAVPNFKECLYINGLAENLNGSPKNKIVFGIDSSVELKNPCFNIFTKTVQRSIKNTDVYKLRSIAEKNIEKVYVIGHSLSVADKESLLTIIANKKDNISDAPTVIIYYYDEKGKVDQVMNLFELLGCDTFTLFQQNNKLQFYPIDTVR